ncbi:DUF6907 domain-containing protein [Streptomyces fractus]|uniref:DUF6907 domain-containing protein n=1 Tax=Streptomyces fractus TaxID=641806 RepID=UPI003CF881E3
MTHHATVTALNPAGPECPSWCAREPRAEATGSHISEPIALAAPASLSPTTGIPLLSVQLALGHEEQAHAELPRLWLAAPDTTAELDVPGLTELIDGLDDFALRLRGLRHRYDTVIVGDAEESINARPSPTHPLELVAPCPPWCQYRENGDDHTAGPPRPRRRRHPQWRSGIDHPPHGAEGPYRDEEVATLLAEVHESQHELTTQDGPAAHQRGSLPTRGPWPWTVVADAS